MKIWIATNYIKGFILLIVCWKGLLMASCVKASILRLSYYVDIVIEDLSFKYFLLFFKELYIQLNFFKGKVIDFKSAYITHR